MRISDYFQQRDWPVLDFQREAWAAYQRGESALVHAPTGSGKTLAVWGAIIDDALCDARDRGSSSATRASATKIIWITPLKALANDTAESLRAPLQTLGLNWTIGVRTGDASAKDKRLAKGGKFDALISTPESLALMLCDTEFNQHFANLECIVVDEWHELLANKRGVLLSLMIAELRARFPKLRIWGMSATLANLDAAARALMGARYTLIRGPKAQMPVIETLLPAQHTRFPWAGHLGLSLLPRVLEKLANYQSSIIFTNTRAHAELWYQALQSVWLDAPNTLALHHGSLDHSLRVSVEQALKAGSVRCVVSTSSLDLGVDFPAVDAVFQTGSPKSIARFVQRAGRAAHRPNGVANVFCLPTHQLELLEFAALRLALVDAALEDKRVPNAPLDVLAQHLCTMALGGGFDAPQALQRVRRCSAYADLSDDDFAALLRFLRDGGDALSSYPQYQRLVETAPDFFQLIDKKQALRHRLNIGTIVSDTGAQVRLGKNGQMLGTVEESYLARLQPGDRFWFAGRALKLIQMNGMEAYVRLSANGANISVPRWMGGSVPLSSSLAQRVQQLFTQNIAGVEGQGAANLLQLQKEVSQLPELGKLLIEVHAIRDGRLGKQALVLFPFAGRSLHEALATLIVTRLACKQPSTFEFAVNDFGIILLASKPFMPIDRHDRTALLHEVLNAENLHSDLAQGANLSELSRRQFREIARISGLLTPAQPGKAAPSMRSLQASSALIFDALQSYDPNHILLKQTERAVFESTLQEDALRDLLNDLRRRDWMLETPKQLTPLSFPLWVENLRASVSSESWRDRVLRAAHALEQDADLQDFGPLRRRT